MNYYNVIMEAESAGVGDFLDSRMVKRGDKLSAYYKDKYGYGFHTSIALLKTGTMPGYERQVVSDMVDEIWHKLGIELDCLYFNVTVSPKLKKHFKLRFDGLPYQRSIKKESSGPYKHPDYIGKLNSVNRCMECNKEFEVDAKNHPANLCICTKCSPNGVCYGESKGAHGIHYTGRQANS